MKGLVQLAHGSGGMEMAELLRLLFFERVPDRLKRVNGGVGIDKPDDSALIPIGEGKYVVISIDSYTVNPPFFPGGNIGTLAATGSINDVAVMGGVPLAVLDSIVVEEGFPLEDLEVIVESFIDILAKDDVRLVGGDFKVMPKGQLDKIVITTACLGLTDKPIVDAPREGDKIVVSGYLGDHGAVIMMCQLGECKSAEASGLRSDVKSLAKVMKELNERLWPHIHAARDPTRGGLAGVLTEWASSGGLTIMVDESAVPVRRETAYYAGLLGIDPLYLASEGAVVLSVEGNYAEEALDVLRRHGFEQASIVGEVKRVRELEGLVVLKTVVGGRRLLEPPMGELVPRIC